MCESIIDKIDMDECKKWIDEHSKRMEYANRVSAKFEERVKAMPLERQDELMHRIIAKYASKEYNDRYWNNGIFPNYMLFDYIADLMYANGGVVGKTDDGEDIVKYNHWRVDSVCGQGQTHYNFVFDDKKERLKDFMGCYQYPFLDDITNMDNDTFFSYTGLHAALMVANYMRCNGAFMIARYSCKDNLDMRDTIKLDKDDPCLKNYYDNIKEMESVPNGNWHHTNYGKYAIDDVILTGESDKNYWCVWLDKDVSDCCIWKVSKPHYINADDFKEAVRFELESDGYLITPIRQPKGCVEW